MSRISLLMSVLVSVFTLQAQDRIITVQNDTVNCQIQSITDTHIRYEQPSKDGFVVGKLIPLTEVAEYYRKPGTTITRTKVENPWVLGINIGGGYLPWVLETIDKSGRINNASKIENGYQLNTSVHYLFNTFIGVGLQYSFFTSGYKGDVLREIDPSYPIYFYLYERYRQYINYGGLSVLFQQPIGAKKRIVLSETLSLGMLFYRYEYQNYGLPYVPGYNDYMTYGLVEGASLGTNLGLSAGYYVLPKLLVGVGADFLFGKTKKIHSQVKSLQGRYERREDYVLATPLNLSRLNYSLVIRYTL